MRKQLCKEDHSENRAGHDLCHLSNINRNTEFISGCMRIISYVSLVILFFYKFIQCIKCSKGLKIGFFPFVNVQIIHKGTELRYPRYKRCNVETRFGAKPTSLTKRTEFDYYCPHSYAFSEKTNCVTKDFNFIYI